MKAKKKTLEALKPEALGVDVSPRLHAESRRAPKRKAGVKVADAKALVDKLRNEAKVDLLMADLWSSPSTTTRASRRPR